MESQKLKVQSILHVKCPITARTLLVTYKLCNLKWTLHACKFPKISSDHLSYAWWYSTKYKTLMKSASEICKWNLQWCIKMQVLMRERASGFALVHLCLVCGMRTISRSVKHLFYVWMECVGCPDFEIKKAWNDI